MTIDELDQAIQADENDEVTYRDRRVFLSGAKFQRDHPIENLDEMLAMRDVRRVTIK